MDKLEAMRSFVEVAHTQSFTQAADKLGLSRIRVTRDVQELEEWLQQRLLHRTTRRVSLTSAGEQVLHYCQRILDSTYELQNQVRADAKMLAGTIRITTPIGLGQSVMLDVIAQFQRRHPHVHFHLLMSDYHVQLVDERIDIALRFTSEPDSQLIARKLTTMRSWVCATPSYLEQHGVPQEPSDLSAHACLLHLDSAWFFTKDAKQIRQLVQGPLQMNDIIAIKEATLKHLGIGCIPDHLAAPLIKSGQLVTVLDGYELPPLVLWALYLSRTYQQPQVRAFIDFLAEYWQ